MAQLKRPIRMGKAVVSAERGYVRQFGLVGSKKLLPGWNVEKQIPRRDRRSGSQRRFIAAQQLASRNLDPRSGLLIARPGFKHQPGDGGDRRKRFTTKAQSC